MTDADLLDLLEILETINTGLETESKSISAKVYYGRADRMIQSFRSAIRQRMNHSQGEV